MIYAALYLFLLLVVLDRLRSISLSTSVFRSQCRLFEVRDHLREGAMNGKVNDSNWVFHYLDSTIVKTIDSLDRLTIWRIIGIALSGIDEKTKQAVVLLDTELARPGNEYLRKVHAMYMALLTIYLIESSLLLKWLLRCLLGLAMLKEQVNRQVTRVASIATAAPETSTLADFVPA